MDTTEEQTAGSVTTMMIDEFISPKCRDTEDGKQLSELRLESELSYAPSPSITRIKESMFNFSDEQNKPLKAKELFEPVASSKDDKNQNNNNTKDVWEHDSFLDDVTEQTDDNKENIPPSKTVVYTTKPIMTDTKKHQTATKTRSVLMPIKQSQSSQSKCTNNQTIIKRETNVKKIAGTSNLVQENQAIKRQKLDGGKSKQILNPKPKTLPHKTNQGLVNTSFNLCASATKQTRTENRKVYVRDKITPVVPTKPKTSTEIEQEELKKMPKFKARPLNKKIFESKVEMGIFRNTKKHVTIPQDFHFMTEGSISRPNSVIDLFDKLSLNSESRREKPQQRNTTPTPFLLRTEERGAEKMKKFVREVIHKQMEDKRVRVPKANPYPYTTDYPVVPPKPEPKQCTKPEPFQLESLARHEEEMRKEMEEKIRMKREEAQRRIFKAQPMIKENPIPVPERERMPLTEIQEFSLHVDHRAIERANFDYKIKEKEMMYKRYREEIEAAKMVEEERAVKQLRRTMIPLARPMPNFNNPFLPQKSNKETTKPKSPKLRVIRRIESRTMTTSTNMS